MSVPKTARPLYDTLGPAAFTRKDETDDAIFYTKPRMVPHIDAVARATVARVIEALVVESEPVILDLMSSWDSHLPRALQPGKVVGLGLNAEELDQNEALDERVVHDLNQDPSLPFEDEQFDVVINTVSVEYLTKPLEVFAEVARVLKPGGLHLVVFSNRMFPPKTVQVWQDGSERERVWLVQDYFDHSGELYDKHQLFASQGKVRPPDDPYADKGIPSDPIYAVYADKRGASPDRGPRPTIPSEAGDPIDPEELARRKERVRETLECPYCQQRLERIDLEQTPFFEWDFDHAYVCLNNRCSYYVSSFEDMAAQGNMGFSCRLMYDPIRDMCRPTADITGPIDPKGRVTPRG